MAGLNFGLRPILINHTYNQDFSHPDILKVNNWRDIHTLLKNENIRRT